MSAPRRPAASAYTVPMRALPYLLIFTSGLILAACEGKCIDGGPGCNQTLDPSATTDPTTIEPTTTDPTLTSSGPGSGTEGTGSGTEGASSGTSSGPSSSSGSGTDTGGDPGAPSTYGEACAPDDGPAVEFKIGLDVRACTGVFPEDAPIFRIVLFQGVDLPVGEHKLDGGFGFAYLDKGDGMPLSGMTGALTVSAKTADGLVGTYDVTLEDSTQLSGSFDALYCPQDVLCG